MPDGLRFCKSRYDEKEIKRSINSQILTVFTAPLLMAGVHLALPFRCCTGC